MACIDRDIIIYHTETKKDYDALIDDLDKKGYMWQSFMPLKLRDYWGFYHEKTCIGVRSEGKNVFCSSFSALIHSHEIYKYEAKEDIEMKIYHTETQADYDALMKKLEAEGIEALSKKYWPTFKTETTVVVRAQSGEKRNCENRTTYGNLSRVRSRYDTPIIKYKAKMDDEMKLTKENVGKILDEWFTENTHLSAEGIIANIEELDDAPEKVGVPKYIAEFYESKKHLILSEILKEFETNTEKEVADWYFSNNGRHVNTIANSQEVIVKMHLYGYTIEPEKLYYIPLPDLETSDGLQQVLSKRENGMNYFASRPNDKLKQRFTKDEIAQVPEFYKPYAKPIEEEEE
ncbi:MULTISPECIES: DUF1642 domain-containing protein [Jeotgalibaca]